VWSPRAAESKGRKNGRQNGYFKYKDFDFPSSSDFKLPSEIEGNYINDLDYFCIYTFRYRRPM